MCRHKHRINDYNEQDKGLENPPFNNPDAHAPKTVGLVEAIEACLAVGKLFSMDMKRRRFILLI